MYLLIALILLGCRNCGTNPWQKKKARTGRHPHL